jgi:transposase
MKRCFYCGGQFGLTRRRWSGRQFCSLWCLAWFEKEARERKKAEDRAVARYAGLTGSPDESGLKRREKGLPRAGNARVRRGLIQLAWRFLMFQKDSALARWHRTRTEGPSGARKTTMIVALARKLLIALWRLVTTGEVPDGVELRPAAHSVPIA